MKRRVLAYALLALVVLTSGAAADAAALPRPKPQPAQLLGGPVDLDPYIGQLLTDYLTMNPPAPTTLYAPTYVGKTDTGTAVSLVGLAPDAPADWNIQDHAIWTGTLILRDGVWQPLTVRRGALRQASPLRPAGPGGGADVMLPVAPGTHVYYGTRGVHGEGDYGTSGMYAVDLVGGDTLGANVMPSLIYASYSGAIDFICTDGTSIAIRTDDGAGNVFVYAHLDAGQTYNIGDTFAFGQTIGRLRYGSFNDQCGWAVQSPTNYHVHWMFTPADGRFQAGGWVLTLSDSIWRYGLTAVAPGQWLGGAPDPAAEGDPTQPPVIIDAETGVVAFTGNHIWDYLLGGVYSLVGNTIFSIFPRATDVETTAIWDMVSGMIAYTIRNANLLLVNEAVNLLPWILLAGFVLGMESIIWVVGLTLSALRAVRAVI